MLTYKFIQQIVIIVSMSPELLTAVKERIALGYDHDAIRNELRQAGHSEDVIAQVMQAAAPGEDGATAVMPQSVGALPGGTDLFSLGWKFATSRWDLVFALAAPFLATAVIEYVVTLSLGGDSAAAGLTVLLATLLALYVYFVLLTGAVRLSLDSNLSNSTLAEVWDWGTSRVSGLFWVLVLSGLVAMGGFMLFIIPGIILSLYVYLAQYVYVQEGTRGIAALLRSRDLVVGRWWELAVRVIVVSLLLILIFIALGLAVGMVAYLLAEGPLAELVIALVTQVFSALATLLGLAVGATVYHNFSATRPATATPLPGKGKYITVALIGLLFPVAMIFIAIAFASLGTAVEISEGDYYHTAPQTYEAKERALELRAEEDLEQMLDAFEGY